MQEERKRVNDFSPVVCRPWAHYNTDGLILGWQCSMKRAKIHGKP